MEREHCLCDLQPPNMDKSKLPLFRKKLGFKGPSTSSKKCDSGRGKEASRGVSVGGDVPRHVLLSGGSDVLSTTTTAATATVTTTTMCVNQSSKGHNGPVKVTEKGVKGETNAKQGQPGGSVSISSPPVPVLSIKASCKRTPPPLPPPRSTSAYTIGHPKPGTPPYQPRKSSLPASLGHNNTPSPRDAREKGSPSPSPSQNQAQLPLQQNTRSTSKENVTPEDCYTTRDYNLPVDAFRGDSVRIKGGVVRSTSGAMTTAADNSVYGYAKDVLPEVWQMSTSRSAPHCAFLQTPNEEITSRQWRLKRELSLPEDFKSGIDSQDNVQRLGADPAQHKLRSYSLPASSQDESAVTGGGSEVNDPNKVTSHVLQSGAVSQSNLPEGVTCYTLCSAHVATKHGNTVNRHDLVGPPNSSLSRPLEPSRSHGQLASASVGLMEPIMERSGDWDSLEELHAGIVSPLPSPSIRSSSITPTSSLKRSSFTSPSCGVRMAELRASRRQHGGDGSKSGSPSPEPASPHRRSPCHSPSPQRFSPSFGFSPWGLEIAGRLQRPPIHTIVEENDRSSDKHSRTSVTPSTPPTCTGQGFLSKAKLKTKAPSRQDNTDYGSVSSIHSLVDKTTSIRSTDLDPNRGSNSSTPTFQENDPSASSQCFTCPPPSPHKGASPHANITTGTRYHPSYEASVNTNDLREAGDAHIEIHIARTSQPDSINNDHSARNSHRYTSAYSTCQAKGAPGNKAALSEASIRDRLQPPSSAMGAGERSATSNWDTSPYYFVYDRPDILARLGIDACENRDFLQPSVVNKTHLEVGENHSSTNSTPNQRSCQSRYSDYTSFELSPPLQPTRNPRSQTLSQVTPILSDKSLNSRVETDTNSKLHQPKSIQRLDNFGQVDPDLCLSPGSVHGDGFGIVYDALDVDCTDSDDSDEIYEKLDPDWCKIREHVPVSNKPLDDEIYTPLSSKTHAKSKISSRSESNGRTNVQRGRSASAQQTKIHKRQCQKKIPGNEDPRPGLSISTSLNSSQTSVASGASEPDQTGPSSSIAKRPLKKPAPLNVSKKILHSTASDTPGDVQSQRSPTNKSRSSGVQVRGAAYRQQDRAETDSSHNKAVIADNADKKTGRKHSIPGPISPKRLPVPAPTSDSTKPGSPRLLAIQSQQQKSIKNVSTDSVVVQSPGNGKCKSGKNSGVSPVSSPRRLTAGRHSKLPGYKRSASDSGQVTSAVTTTTASVVHEASTRAPVVVGTSSIPGTVSKPASYKATYLSTPESLTNTKMTPASTSATLASLKPLTVNPASTSSVSATLSTTAVFTTTPASTSTSTCSDQPSTVTSSSSSLSSSLHQPAQLTMHTHPSMARLVSLRETKTDLKCTPDTKPKPHEDILLRVREGLKLSEGSSSGQKALISGKRDAATNTKSVLQILRQRGLIKPKAIDTSTKQTSTPQAGEKTNVAEAISPSDKGDPIKDGTAGTKMMRAEEDGGIVEALHCSNKMPDHPCATKDAVPMQGYEVMNSERRSEDEMKDDKMKWEAGVGSLGEEMLKGSLHHPNTRRVSSQGNSHNQGHAALNSTIKDLSSNYPASVSSPPASVPPPSDDNIKNPADIPQQCSTTRLGVENASSNSEGASSAEGIVVGGGDQRTIIGNYCKPNAAQERCAAVQSHAGLTSGSRSIMDDSISNTTQTDASNHVACSRSYSMQSSNGTSPVSSMPQTCQPRLVKPYSSLSRSQPYSARFNLLSRGRLSTTNVPSTGCESNVVNTNGVLQMTYKMASSSDPTLHNHRYTPERCAVPEHSLSSSAGPALLSPPQETNKQRQENMNGRCMSKHCMNGKENISEQDLQNKNSLGTSKNEQDGSGELGAPGKTREGGNEVAMVRGKLSQTQLVVPEGEMTDCALASNVRVSSTQTSPEASNNTSTPSHSNATLLSDPHVPANTRKNSSSEHCETRQKDAEAGTTCASAGAGVEGGTTRNTSWNVVGEMKDEGVKRGTSPTRYPGASSYPKENMVELILSNQLPKDDKMVGYVDSMEAASGVATPPPVHAHTNNEEEVDSAGLLPTLRSLDGGLDNASRAAGDVNWRPTCWRRGGDKEGHLVATDEGQLRGRISGSHNEADRSPRSNDSASASDGHRVSNDQKSPGGLNEASGQHPSGDEYPPGGQHPTYDHHAVHNICALAVANSVPANLPSEGNISHPYTSLPTSAQPTGPKAHVGVPRGDIDVHKQCPPSSAAAAAAAAAARVDSTDNKADMQGEVLEKSNGECSRQKTQAPVNNKQFDRLMGETECESSLECSMNELNGSPKWKQNGPATDPLVSNRSIQGRLADNESSADLRAVNGDEGSGRLSHRERSEHETQPHIDQPYKSALGTPMGRNSCSLEDGENNSNETMSQEPEVNSQEFMATNSHDPSVSCSPWPALVATCYHSSLIRASPKMHGYVSWVGQHGLKSHSETDCTSVLSTLHYPSMPKIASHRATSRRLGMATYAVCPELSISEASIPYVDTGVTMTTEFNESLPAGFQPWTRDGLLGTYIHYRYSAPSQQCPYYNANPSHYQQHHPDFISNIRLSESGYDSWKSHDSTSTAAHRDSLDESDDLIGGKHELDPDVFFHSSTNSSLTDVDTLRPMRHQHGATSCAHAYSGFSKHYPGVSYYSGDTCSSNDTILATEHETHEITTTKYSTMHDASILIPTYADYISNPLSDIRGSIPVGLEKVLSGGGVLKVASPVNIGMPFSSQSDPSCDTLLDCKNQDDASSPSDSTESYIAVSDHNFAKTDSDETIHGEEVGVKSGEVVAFDSAPAGAGGEGQDLCGVSEGCDGQTVSIPSVIALSSPTNVSPTSKSSIHDIVTAPNREETPWCPQQLHQPNIAQLPPNIAQSGIAPMAPVCSQHRMTPVSLNPPQQKLGVAILKEAGGVTTAINDDSVGRPLTLGDHASQATYNAAGAGEISKAECLKDACHEASLPTHQHQQPEEENRCSNNEFSDLSSITAVEASSNNAPMPGSQHPHLTANYHESNSDPFSAALSDEEATERLQCGSSPAGEEGAILHPLHPRTYTPPDELMTDLHGSSSLLAPHRSHLPDQQSSDPDQAMTYDSIVTLNLPSNGIYEPVCLNTDDVMTGSDTTVLTNSSHTYESIEESNMSASTHSYESIDEDLMKRCEAHSTSLQPSAIVPFVHVKEMTSSMKQEGEKSNSAPDIPHTGVGASYLTDEAHLKRAGKMAELNVDVSADAVSEVPHHVIKETAVSESSLHAEYSLDLELTPTEGTYVSIERTPSRDSLLDAVEGNSQTPEQPILLSKGGDDDTTPTGDTPVEYHPTFILPAPVKEHLPLSPKCPSPPVKIPSKLWFSGFKVKPRKKTDAIPKHMSHREDATTSRVELDVHCRQQKPKDGVKLEEIYERKVSQMSSGINRPIGAIKPSITAPKPPRRSIFSSKPIKSKTSIEKSFKVKSNSVDIDTKTHVGESPLRHSSLSESTTKLKGPGSFVRKSTPPRLINMEQSRQSRASSVTEPGSSGIRYASKFAVSTNRHVPIESLPLHSDKPSQQKLKSQAITCQKSGLSTRMLSKEKSPVMTSAKKSNEPSTRAFSPAKSAAPPSMGPKGQSNSTTYSGKQGQSISNINLPNGESQSARQRSSIPTPGSRLPKQRTSALRSMRKSWPSRDTKH